MKKQSSLCYKDVIGEQLVERVGAVFADSDTDFVRLYRFEVETDGLSVPDWLAVQKTDVKVYWSDRDGSSEIAGVGVADILTDSNHAQLSNVLATVEENIDSAKGSIRYYGGICFDGDHSLAEPWADFGRFCFLVPEFELRRENGRMIFAFNTRCEQNATAESTVQKLRDSLEQLNFKDTAEELAGSVVSNRIDIPDKSQWRRTVRQALADMPAKDIGKIVLSRKTVLEMSQPVDAIRLLTEVGRQNMNTYDFCFQLNDRDAFIGCSPECLFSRRGDEIYSEAIAGTCPAGDSDSERLQHQAELLRSAKELEEHGYVHDNVKADLGEICSEIEVVDDRHIVSLSYVQHFCSRFKGALADDVDTYNIIEALHPTAAVNGFPKEAAREEIRVCERVSRGWYAGPVGWIGENSSEFAVGIRSARVQGSRISLFVGAGLVKASDAELEWDETENKLRLFLDVIGVRSQETS